MSKVVTAGECNLNSAVAWALFPSVTPYHGQDQSRTIRYVEKIIRDPRGDVVEVYALIDIEGRERNRDKYLRFNKLIEELVSESETAITDIRDSKVPGIVGHLFVTRKNERMVRVFLIGFDPKPEELIEKYGDSELKELIRDHSVYKAIKSRRMLEHARKTYNCSPGRVCRCPPSSDVCKIVDFLKERVGHVIALLRKKGGLEG